MSKASFHSFRLPAETLFPPHPFCLLLRLVVQAASTTTSVPGLSGTQRHTSPEGKMTEPPLQTATPPNLRNYPPDLG